MPEYIRSLIVILVLAAIVFAFAHRPAVSISGAADFTRRRNLWFGLTLAAFLGHGYWIYMGIAILLLSFANRREHNPTALFFFVLFVVPELPVPIPGLGLINYVFELPHSRLLSLFILLPVSLLLMRRSDTTSFGRTWPDKAMAGYLLLLAVLSFRGDSFTNSLRQIFYLFTDIYLPYYVFSRSLTNLQAFRDTSISLVLAIMVLALLGSFEFLKHWLLYSSLSDSLGLGGGIDYLGRDGMLRAVVSSGQSIVLGYLMVVGIGLYLLFHRSIQSKFSYRLGMLLLLAGLISPVSRGPWLGAVLLLIIFIATGRYAVRRLMALGMAGMLALSLAAVLPGGERVLNLLPFIGKTEIKNVDYRERLIENSMIVIKRNPWFGSTDYMKTPEMESMRQGQGIIDIVNSYIAVALRAGVVGLTLYVGFFILTVLGLFRAMRSIPDRNSDEYLLGQVLLATMSSVLFIIFTVSSISYIPVVYWSLAGMCVAYTLMIRKKTVRELRS